ncbi:MAG: Cys-tRNA(Pro) deacylase [Eubacteriales bacterium]|mgnify:CR=1 FL=1|nr:Cys-tRNA(Pro) deacylase [Eubacteriales bacterium]
MKKPPKTNAMRLLDRAGIRYDVRQYPYDEDDLSGVKAAAALGLPPDQVYKTLVAHGDRSGYLVCCLAVHQTVDLKKLALLSGNKRVELVHVNELLPLTGYLRGGCSPLGMKKTWPTYLDERALKQSSIAVSAGQRGLQMVLRPQDLITATSAVSGDVAADHEP